MMSYLMRTIYHLVFLRKHWIYLFNTFYNNITKFNNRCSRKVLIYKEMTMMIRPFSSSLVIRLMKHRINIVLIEPVYSIIYYE